METGVRVSCRADAGFWCLKQELGYSLLLLSWRRYRSQSLLEVRQALSLSVAVWCCIVYSGRCDDDFHNGAGLYTFTENISIDVLNTLDSICGGMTSTPALGTLIAMTRSEAVAVSCAATYPVALIMVVLSCEFLPILCG